MIYLKTISSENNLRFTGTSIVLLLSTLLSTSIIFTSTNIAAQNKSFIEYTQSLDVSTFDNIKTIGIYSRSYQSHDEVFYGGLQFSQFEFKNSKKTSGLYRVLIGVATTGKIAPFIEIGTDIIGLFTAGNVKQTNCDDGNNCRIDGFLKIGVRFHLQHIYTLGVFHESIVFNDNHRLLKGDHNYTGLSLGYDF